MIKDITIYIPTYKRTNNVLTLKYIDRSLDSVTHLVVRPEEAKDYFISYPHLTPVILPRSASNIVQTRQYILDSCKTKYCVMLDDDLRFNYRPNRADYHLKTWEEPKMVEMLEEMLAYMEENDVVHCAVSAREGNNREHKNWRLNERYMRAYIYDTDVVSQFRYHQDCDGVEDFNMALQLITAGYKSAVAYAWAQGHSTSSAPGGMSAYRNIEYHNRAIVALQARFPKYVKLREVKTKKSWGGQTRIDATISWKKAYEDSPKMISSSCPPAERIHP